MKYILPAFVSLFMMTGCDGGGGAGPCECGDGTYCCVDHCQPLGTVCGGEDAVDDPDAVHDVQPEADVTPEGDDEEGGEEDVSTDDAVDVVPDDTAGEEDAAPDCSPRPGPDGTPAPVTALCVDGDTTWSCEVEMLQDCNESWPDCHEWYDPATAAWTAACLESYVDPCDPSVDESHCDGALIIWCNENINYPTFGPPGYQRQVDCRDRWGADGHCVSDSTGLHCDSPSVERCDPATYNVQCLDDLTGAWVCASDILIVEVSTCPAGEYCLDNEYTRASPYVEVDCIPSSAVPSSEPPTTDLVPLFCDGADALRVEQYGMEWTEACEWTLVIRPDGTYEWLPTVCYDATGTPRCELPSTEHCDPATYATHCSDDQAGSITCEGDTARYSSCGMFGVPGVCDPANGLCVPWEPCSPDWPYTQRCILDNTYRMVCFPDIGVAGPEPCPGCHVDVPDGPALCSP
jgi:hypothetical protein